MRFITGQQAQLAKLAEIQQARLQGDVGLAQERQAQQQAAAKARLDYEDTLAQRELARQQAEAEAGQPMTLSPGQTVYDPRTGQALYTAPSAGETVTLSPGQKVYDSQGRLIASNDSASDKLTTLGKDQILVDSQGNIVARGESATGGDKAVERQMSDIYAFTRLVGDPSDPNDRGSIGAVENLFEATKGIGGLGRQQASKIGGTKSFDLKTNIDTLKAALAFDRLQEMRNNSPTGGALGQVSDNELRLLSSAVAALDVGQSNDTLEANLNTVRDHYQYLLEKAQADLRSMQGGDALDAALDRVGFNRVGGDTNGAASGYQVSGYGSDYWKHGLDVVVGERGSSVSLPVSGTVVDVVSGFSNPSGKPLASETGRSQNKGFGNQVKIRLADGREVWVSHLDSVSVRKGQQVKAGQALGTQGNTGLTYGKTGVHVDITAKKPDGSYYTPQEVERLFLSRA